MTQGRILLGEHKGVYLLKFVGDVRVNLCVTMDTCLREVLDQKNFCSALVDLSETDGIDSTALGLLARLSLETKRRYGAVPTLVSTRGVSWRYGLTRATRARDARAARASNHISRISSPSAHPSPSRLPSRRASRRPRPTRAANILPIQSRRRARHRVVARARSSRSSSFASHLVVARLANGRLLRRDLLRRRLLRRRGFLHRRLRRGGFRLEHRECARVVGVWRRARSSERSRADRIAIALFARPCASHSGSVYHHVFRAFICFLYGCITGFNAYARVG